MYPDSSSLLLHEIQVFSHAYTSRQRQLSSLEWRNLSKLAHEVLLIVPSCEHLKRTTGQPRKEGGKWEMWC